jgi:predicted nucleic acid-binding protein
MAEAGRTYLVCDANVFVRLLTDDPPEMAEAVVAALDAAGRGEFVAILTDVVVAEIAYVLTGPYELERAQAADRIESLLEMRGVEVADIGVLRKTLEVWRAHPIDFADAYLAALAASIRDTGVLSFDHDLDRTEGVQRIDPAAFLPSSP